MMEMTDKKLIRKEGNKVYVDELVKEIMKTKKNVLKELDYK